MRIAAPEQVDQYLNKVLGVEAKLKALNTNLTHLKERAAELQVEREIQRVVPVANDEKTEEEREAWDREAGSRVKQYDEALSDIANIIGTLEEQKVVLESSQEGKNRAAKRREEKAKKKRLS